MVFTFSLMSTVDQWATSCRTGLMSQGTIQGGWRIVFFLNSSFYRQLNVHCLCVMEYYVFMKTCDELYVQMADKNFVAVDWRNQTTHSDPCCKVQWHPAIFVAFPAQAEGDSYKKHGKSSFCCVPVWHSLASLTDKYDTILKYMKQNTYMSSCHPEI